MPNEENREIHSYYAIGILLLIIVWLATEQWSDIPDVVRYLEFALALTSFVVSVIAIILSTLSQSSLEKSVSRIQDASKKVESDSETLETRTKQVLERLVTIESTIAKTPDLIRELIQPPEPVSSTPGTTDFLRSSSIAGLLALKIVKLSIQNRREFILSNVVPDQSDARYMYGFLVAASSAGIFTRFMTGSNWRVTSLAQGVSDDLDSEIERRMPNLAPAGRIHMQSVLDHITAFFA